MASLAIGVSKAERLPYLRGALNGAIEFHKWASAAGYESGVLTDEGDSQVTDWFSEWRAVNVEQLKRRLGWYGVSQISVFADACKKFPANIDTGDINEDSVLGRGPSSRRIPRISTPSMRCRTATPPS